MTLLAFSDQGGNGDAYLLEVPESMTRWRVDALWDYLIGGHDAADEQGFLVRPVAPLHFEALRQLVLAPQTTLNAPIVWEQNGVRLGMEDTLDLRHPVNTVTLQRDEAVGHPDGSQVSVTAANHRIFASCRNTLVEAFDQLFDFNAVPMTNRQGRRVTSLAECVEDFSEQFDSLMQRRFLHRVAQVIHAAPFENISKIQAGIQCRGGAEMWPHMTRGWGGICAEKTAALRFICDILGLIYRPVIGAADELPENFEATLRAYVDSRGERELPVWVQHYLLEVELADDHYLLDVTGGNIPLLMLNQVDSAVFIKQGLRARMVYRVERLRLARASTWAGDVLLTLGQYHVPELHLQYIFQQGLGLHIDDECFIGVYFDWGGQRTAVMQQYYSRLAQTVGYPYPRFIHRDNLVSVPDHDLRVTLERTLDALRNFYEDRHYTGDFTLVLQPLVPNRWQQSRLSREVRQAIRVV